MASVEFWGGRVFAFSLIVLFTAPLFDQGVGVAEGSAALSPRGAIQIFGNDDFTSSNGVVRGSGMPTDPFVIEGWSIVTALSFGLAVSHTTAWFTIVDCTVGSLDEPTLLYGVHLDDVSNCHIDRVAVTNCQIAMMLSDVDNVKVDSCEVSESMDGIYVSGASGPVAVTRNSIVDVQQSIEVNHAIRGVEVVENIVTTGDRWPSEGLIHVFSCSGGRVSGNTVTGVRGIQIGFTTGLIVEDNILIGCSLDVWGDKSEYISSNRITTSNKVNGQPVLQICDARDAVIDCSFYGEIIAANLLRVSLFGFGMAGAGDVGLMGVSIAFSSQVTLEGSSFSQMPYGIYLRDSSYLAVRGCSLYNGTGIFSSGVHDLEITGNSFFRGSSLLLISTTNCRVYHNNIYAVPAEFLVAYNRNDSLSFDNGYPDGGNYWDTATHTDSNSDGICDQPVIIPTNIIDVQFNDSYPLMKPFGKSSSNDSFMFWALIGMVGLTAVGFLVSFRKKPIHKKGD